MRNPETLAGVPVHRFRADNCWGSTTPNGYDNYGCDFVIRNQADDLRLCDFHRQDILGRS